MIMKISMVPKVLLEADDLVSYLSQLCQFILKSHGQIISIFSGK